MTNRKLSVFVQENLDFDTLLDELGVTRNRGRHKDVFRYIIGTINHLRFRYRNQDGNQEFEPRLSATSLLEVIGSGYAKYLRDLEYLGVVTRGGSYQTGRTCKKVSLKPLYIDQPLVKVDMKDLAIRRNIRKITPKRLRANKRELGDYKDLLNFFRSGDLLVNEEAARNWIISYSEMMTWKIEQGEPNESKCKKLLTQLKTTRSHHEASIDRLLGSAEEICEFDFFGYRFYTPLTNLKGELRHFLTYQNESLAMIDIRNSQPYFKLALLNGLGTQGLSVQEQVRLEQWMKEGPQWVKKRKEEMKRTRKRVRDEEREEMESIILNDVRQTLATKGFQGNCNDSSYANLVINGAIYQNLSYDFEGKYVRKSGYDPFSPQNVKRTMLWLMYHDPSSRTQGWSDFYKPVYAFKQRFPKEFELMELLKEGDYRRLSRILQRLESFVMFQLVRPRITRELPEAPWTFIHDCILTTERYHMQVASILQEECEKVVGVSPKLKIEPLLPEMASESLNQLANENPISVVQNIYEKQRSQKMKQTRK